MTPYALQIHAPGGKNRTVYQFHDIERNAPQILEEDFFPRPAPPCWEGVIVEPFALWVGPAAESAPLR